MLVNQCIESLNSVDYIFWHNAQTTTCFNYRNKQQRFNRVTIFIWVQIQVKHHIDCYKRRWENHLYSLRMYQL